DDPTDTCRDLCFDQLFECRNVNAAIAKWRNQCRERAAKHRKRLKRYKGYKVKKDTSPGTKASDLDCAFEHELRWAGECDVAETSLDFLETDFKFVSAPR